LETKRGFCWERVPSQKTSLVFTHLSPFERYKEIVGPYFSGICQIYFPKKFLVRCQEALGEMPRERKEEATIVLLREQEVLGEMPRGSW
jgi:hypothetical protein